ncbi:MAG: Gfo/Idh/MocA family oxidoreductase [Saprospiraceae bacterium]|nr:Gfo/Idh/MocA family oxidoreductase [Saprospiraceae bacterium]
MKSRREFIRDSIVASTGLSMHNNPLLAGRIRTPDPPLNKVRVGFVGIGVKGSQHLGNLMHMDGVEVKAVCDIVEDQCREAQAQAKRLGMPEPRAYFKGEWDFRRMCEEEELDLVYTATPWRWHTPVCMAAMENGSHAATEIPMAITLED